MQTKLLLSWNIRPETESHYFEFLVHEFIPGMNQLGIGKIEVWYTAYGDCEQKLASGVTETLEQMERALQSADWLELTGKLHEYVEDYKQKVIAAPAGFQL